MTPEDMTEVHRCLAEYHRKRHRNAEEQCDKLWEVCLDLIQRIVDLDETGISAIKEATQLRAEELGNLLDIQQ